MAASKTAGDHAIALLLKHHSTESPPAGSAGAAVIIFLRPTPAGDDVEALLIQRTERVHDPASGQVSLPGGRVDPGDQSLSDTALREAEEEVGLGAPDLAGPVRYIGTETAHAFGLRVGIFAGALSPRARAASARSAEEVADVFWLPRPALADRQRVAQPTRDGHREVDATVLDGHVVWGFTRRILREFFGGTPPGGGPDWTPEPVRARGSSTVPEGTRPSPD
ncbi:MAG TPA: CoA pyrophosphatase [Thermoplasmata archaeon]|nr:CoA pyrophosphatase [Thermoplasmata archaeon]